MKRIAVTIIGLSLYGAVHSDEVPTGKYDVVTLSEVPEFYQQDKQKSEKRKYSGSIPSAYVVAGYKHKVPAKILYAVASVESGKRIRKDMKRPWPWTLNIEKKAYYFDTKEEAVEKLESYLSTGKQSVAVGPMQMYWYWHKDKLITPEIALDPHYNIELGVKYLREMYEKNDGDWFKAIGQYHIKERNEAEKAQAHEYRMRVVKVIEEIEEGKR